MLDPGRSDLTAEEEEDIAGAAGDTHPNPPFKSRAERLAHGIARMKEKKGTCRGIQGHVGDI